MMDFGNRLFRSMLLALAGNPAAEQVALRYGLKLGADKYVAGETMSEVLSAVKRLNERGIEATIDHLGEGIRRLAEADAFRDEYMRLLDGIRESGVRATISLKPTQMGLALDPQQAYANIRAIAARAKESDRLVRLDMENSPFTDATIDMARRLNAEGLTNVGTVIQACLRRSEEDVRRLTGERMNLRLVKGAYKESPAIAYAKLEEVNASFRRLIELRLRSGAFTAIATHDERVIEDVRAFVRLHEIPQSAFEFQMLYGVRMELQERLAREGCKVRCYVPYGRMWYPYFVRRLAERPANVWFVLKNVRKR